MFDLTALPLDIYRRNPFRLLGLDPFARRRDIRRRLTDFLSYVELNDTDALRSEVQGGFTALPDEAALRQAAAALEDPFQRLVDELFWFHPQDGGDAGPPSPLSGSSPTKVAKSVSTWLNQEDGKDPLPTHNLAVFHHLMAIEVEQRLTQEISQGGADGLVHALRQESDYCWRHALARWRWLSEHSGFRNWLGARAEAIGADVIDENARNDFARRLPVAILAFNARLALSAAIGCSTEDARRHRELMREAGFTAAAIEEAVRVAVEPLMRRIRERLETFRDEINRTNKAALVGPTRGLIDEVTPALEALDRLLPNDDGPLTDLHEMLAETANIAQVAGSKETGDLAFAVDVLTRIERHARSATLKKTLARNIQITRCFFCKMRPGSTGCAVPVGLYKITAVNPTRKGVSYSKSAIQVPRCQECQNAHRSGKGKTAGGMNILPASKASESVLVTEEYPNGWKLGSEPSDFEVQQAIQQDISSLLGQLSRRGPRT